MGRGHGSLPPLHKYIYIYTIFIPTFLYIYISVVTEREREKDKQNVYSPDLIFVVLPVVCKALVTSFLDDPCSAGPAKQSIDHPQKEWVIAVRSHLLNEKQVYCDVSINK